MAGAADEERPLIYHLPPQAEGSQYTNDGTLDINKRPALKRSTGNWRACLFVLGAEFSESLAFYGISKNLVTYLTGVLHESNIDAARNASTWIGSCFFMPLVGAFLADTYWGRYWTTVAFVSIHAIGMIALTISAWLPLMMDSSYNSSGVHRAAVYLGLYLVAVGSGGIKPCITALGADQFDSADPAERVTKGSFFNWFFLSINLGTLLSSTVLVWVQDNIGWGVGFAIPMALTVLSLAVFVAGRKVYRYRKLQGSPLTRVSQVVVAAVRNHRLTLPEDSSSLHEVPLPSEENCKIVHTNQFRFLDKAAIASPSSGEKGGAGSAMSPWRLCMVSQVEELKMLLRVLPVWASMVLFFAVAEQASSTFIEQGMAMDNRVGPFAVPPASLATFHTVSVVAGIPIYDAALVPLARRATGDDRGLSQLGRLGVGLALSVAAMAYAALVEARRLAAAAAGAGATVSIMWQAPSFRVGRRVGGFHHHRRARVLLRAVAGRHEEPGHLHGAPRDRGRELPELGSARRRRVGHGARRGGWVDPEKLDEGHLDYFFWLLAALSVANLLCFAHCSRRYRDNKAAS